LGGEKKSGGKWLKRPFATELDDWSKKGGGECWRVRN